MFKTLPELLAETVVLSLDWNGLSQDSNIHQVAYDSRGVKPGGLFVAVRGFKHDGHRFIPEAVARARAVVLDAPRLSRQLARYCSGTNNGQP